MRATRSLFICVYCIPVYPSAHAGYRLAYRHIVEIWCNLFDHRYIRKVIELFMQLVENAMDDGILGNRIYVPIPQSCFAAFGLVGHPRSENLVLLDIYCMIVRDNCRCSIESCRMVRRDRHRVSQLVAKCVTCRRELDASLKPG